MLISEVRKLKHLIEMRECTVYDLYVLHATLIAEKRQSLAAKWVHGVLVRK